MPEERSPRALGSSPAASDRRDHHTWCVIVFALFVLALVLIALAGLPLLSFALLALWMTAVYIGRDMDNKQ